MKNARERALLVKRARVCVFHERGLSASAAPTQGDEGGPEARVDMLAEYAAVLDGDLANTDARRETNVVVVEAVTN